MPHLEINQAACYYSGNLKKTGTPVIFCHGSGGAHHHWIYQLKGLKEPAQQIAVSLPGHGLSEGSPFNSVAAYRDWLHHFATRAGLVPFVAAGHSLGGAIVLDYALQYPDELKGLILIGTGGRLKVLPALLEELAEGKIPKSFCDYLYSPVTPEAMVKKGREEMQSTDPALYHTDLTACDGFDLLDRLDKINLPTLIICGSDDRLTPLKYSRSLENSIPGSKLVIIEEAGHMVMLEKPVQVNQAINDFIATLDK